MVSQKEIGKIHPKVEQKPVITGGDFVKSGDTTFLSRLKRSPEIAKHASRLSIQKAALTASAFSIIISSGCGNVEKQNTPPPPEPTPAVSQVEKMPSESIQFTRTPPSTETSSTPSLTESQFEHMSINGIDVALDKEGLPVFYKTADGKKVGFDRDEMRRIKTKAIENKEPEVITVIRSEEEKGESKFQGTKERPLTKKLPKDVVSEEELAERGIKIIQAPQNPNNEKPINLYIREGAFEEGALLHAYENQANKDAESSLQLTIALVDAPFVAQRFLQDSRYDDVRSSLDSENPEELIEEYRQKLLEDLERSRTFSKKHNSNNDEAYDKAELMVLDNGILSKEEILKRIKPSKAKGGSSILAGLHTGFVSTTIGGSATGVKEGYTTIFISVGVPKENFFKNVTDLSHMYFGADGKFNFSKLYITHPLNTLPNLEPKKEQGYPRPEDLELNPSAAREKNDYPYGVQTPGFGLRHETQHNVLTTQALIKGQKSNPNEYDTDMAAMQTIRESWDKWETSGFKDNSGYYFVFSLPEGGYILTENKSPFESAGSPKL